MSILLSDMLPDLADTPKSHERWDIRPSRSEAHVFKTSAPLSPVHHSLLFQMEVFPASLLISSLWPCLFPLPVDYACLGSASPRVWIDSKPTLDNPCYAYSNNATTQGPLPVTIQQMRAFAMHVFRAGEKIYINAGTPSAVGVRSTGNSRYRPSNQAEIGC